MDIDRVQVYRASRKNLGHRFGPLPGIRANGVVAYEFGLPERFEPWPGRSRLERVFVLLELGVSFANPLWIRAVNDDGSVIDRSREGEDCWYVDLITVEEDSNHYTFTDLYIDVMVPTNGRHYRMLDLDEFADAIERGHVTLREVVDALRRWQQFLDRYLHSKRWPTADWSDFPPAAIRDLAKMPSPLGTPVFWEDE